MRLKPKHLGDQLSLDEYNACQYLLYKQSFYETIVLNSETEYEGKLGTYLWDMTKSPEIGLSKYDSLELLSNLHTTEPEHSHNSLYVAITNPLNTHLEYYATLYYQTPSTIATDDSTETYEEYASDAYDIKDETTVPDLNKKTEWKKITVKCTKLSTNSLKIPLYSEEYQEIYEKYTLISRTIDFEIVFDETPYIDRYNGKANQVDEILLDNVTELQKIIKYTPANGEKVIYRLDSNVDYNITQTITIKTGQNIEIRGGTNKKAVIDGSNVGRIFKVQAGASLTLYQLRLQGANANNTTDNTGKGAGILLESTDTSFGVVSCTNCYFTNLTAKYGAGIYSTHAGLFIMDSSFENCTSSEQGGAIYYMSRRVKLTFADIKSSPGKTITLKVNAKYVMTNGTLNDGTIHFYIKNTEIGAASIKNGAATLNYKIPDDYAKASFQVIAYYEGTSTTSSSTVQNTVYVNALKKLTLTIDDPANASMGDTVTFTATATTSDGTVDTTNVGKFTINGTTYTATVKNNKYTCDWKVPTSNVKESYDISFIVENVECIAAANIINIISTDTKGITGLFVNKMTVTQDLVDKWVTAGITDVYVRCNDYSDSSSRNTLETTLSYTKDTSIRVHAAMNCFYDVSTSKYIDPNSTTRMTFLKENIERIAKSTNVDGFCLDYMRFSGATSSENNHVVITKQTKELVNYIHTINKKYITSVPVMPEDATSSTVYGQNFKELGNILDYIMLMAYKGDYNQDNNWIAEQMTYATKEAGNVVGILQTYKDYNNPTKLRTVSDLTSCAKRVIVNGGMGYALFREGLLQGYLESYDKLK
ncbi:hypothetical protein [Methanosphaera sp.]